ncbi:MAG: outer membrane protein transport protein, partial [Litorivicinus sp.]
YSAGVTARAGIHFDPTPTNDTDRSTSTPDGDRTWLSVGASKLLAENLIVDGALTYILVEDGIVNRTTTTGPTPNGLTKAKASGNVGILSLGLRYKF